MRIARVHWCAYRVPFREPYATSRGVVTQREGVLIRLETQDGGIGLGEAVLDPSSNETDTLADAVDALSRDVLRNGADVLEEVPHGDDVQRAAHFALETAVTDIGAKAQGVSIAQLLAEHFGEAPAQTAVRVNATIASRGLEQAAAAALQAKAAGFGTVKLKVGMESSIDAEVERVRTIREVIGPDVRLRLDANGAWDEAMAIVTILALEPYNIEFVEQPTPAEDFEALRRVRDAVTTSIAADEAVIDYETATKAIASADVLVLKPARLGGLSIAAYVAKQALAAGRGVTVTTMIDTGVGTAAALHLAASLPDDSRAHGLATASLLESDLLATSIDVKRGVITLPSAPGLGIMLDDAALAQYSDGWHDVA